MSNMPSQVVQAAPNGQQQRVHLQQLSQENHQQQQPLQPISATQALQMQQQKMQMNPNQVQPGQMIGPATAAVAAQNRSHHIPTAQHQQQYQYQQRPPNGAIPGQQQQQQLQPQMQQPPQYQQQQRVNPQVRAQQCHQSQPVIMPINNGDNIAINPQQQLQPQQIRQVNPQQRTAQHAQQRTQAHYQSQNPPHIPRSIPTPSSQNSMSTSPVPTTPGNTHTPLYERLVTEEVKELKEYVRLIEQQSRRISDLEKVHMDLEKRLEAETTQRQRLEYTLQYRERHWKATSERLDEERSRMESNVKEEKIKVERLLDMVNRLQNEIQSMIFKNKFNPSRSEAHLHSNNNGGIKRVTSGQAANRLRSESGASGSRAEGQPHQSNSGVKNVSKRHIGPHELLACNGSAEAVRERNAFTSLLDFFGM